ncbi:sulfatase [Halalkalicoccus sp. NIPERK01]|uniref:sulfatase n=1 Tax=Halalkalicoccus sp. NIPERK01 TaxID=3053469 RepID=UPI00256F18E8|nr:sulfatase [Halalkalicoccus sp. NIPERK01]MDL5363424.1 sulfatase [Halalkalicoccus sp. NIPERK01]
MTDKNIVLIVMDTARADVLSESGIGSLAEERRYLNTFAASPWSLPSHASLFTGTHSSKHGAHAGHKKLSTEPTTLAEVLADEGYETVAVSNNTWISEEFGFARGFETFHKTWQYVQSDTDLGEIARTKEGTEKLRAVASKLTEGNPLTNVANAIYGRFLRRQQDDGARATNEWIGEWLDSRDGSRPFFLFVNYLEPHLEYRPPEEFAERFLPAGVSYDEAMDVPQNAWAYIAGKTEMTDREFKILRGLYRAELAYLDHRIGELKASLEAAGEWEDTIFVVTGDHGENIGDHGLMDHQYCLYDTLLHVPLIVHGGAFTGGGQSNRLVQLTDLAPTLLDAAGIDAPEAREGFQGVSFHPDADTDPREYAIAEYMAPQPSMEALEKRVGDLPEEVSEYDRSLRAIRTTEYKFIRGSDGSRELYHVATDPGERTDVVGENPEIENDLETELDDWLDSFEHADASGSVSMSRSTKDRLEDLGYLQ